MKYSIKVSDVIDRPDGSAEVQLAFDDDFANWFCKSQKLQAFDQDVFDKWFLDAITTKLENQ